MTAFRARVLFFAFLLTFAGVAVNAMYLQGNGAAWNDVALLKPESAKAAVKKDKPVKRVRRVLPRWNPEVTLSDVPTSGEDAAETGIETQLIAPSVDISPKSKSGRGIVRALQRELTARGYEPGPVDGILGLMTRAAIMAYEHDERITLTAEPSSALLERIVLGGVGQAPTEPRGKPGRHARLLARSVQETLSRLGYAPGPADGIVSTNTARAIRAFERDHGLIVSGRVSGRLISEIGRVNGSRFSIAAGW